MSFARSSAATSSPHRRAGHLRRGCRRGPHRERDPGGRCRFSRRGGHRRPGSGGEAAAGAAPPAGARPGGGPSRGRRPARGAGPGPTDPHLADTPRRVADTYIELLSPPAFDLTTFPNDEGYDELVLARGIPVQSLCEHHLLPFHGVAHVGYLPGARILGLSKLARVVQMFARDLQVQERLTKQVADWLAEHLAAKGVGVLIEADHLCMSLRGVRAAGARTVTSALHGRLREDARSRQEFFALAGVRT